LRIDKLARDLNIGVGKSYLILNQAKEGPAQSVIDILNAEDLELIGTIPEDQVVYEFDHEGRPTIELPDDNAAVKAAFDIFGKIIH
jgi:CO dehydrogenase maturation factor